MSPTYFGAESEPVQVADFVYPGDDVEAPAGPWDKGTAAFRLFLERMMSIRNPTQRGKALELVWFSITKETTLTEAANRMGETKQAFSARAKRIKAIIPIGGLMTEGGKERVAAGVTRSHTRRRREKELAEVNRTSPVHDEQDPVNASPSTKGASL